MKEEQKYPGHREEESEGSSSEDEGEVMGESWRDYPLTSPQVSVDVAHSPFALEHNQGSSTDQKERGKPGWYPGKYLGYKPKTGKATSDSQEGDEGVTSEQRANHHSTASTHSTEDTEEGQQQAQQGEGRESTTSRWFTFRSRGAPSNEEQAATQAEADAQEREESEDSASAQKRERMIAYVARSIRNKFLSRQLIGKIFLYRIAGVISTSMLVEIHQHDIDEYLEQEKEKLLRTTSSSIRDSIDTDGSAAAAAKSSYAYNRALSLTDTILNSLERRSRAWESAEFAKQVYITRGSTIGVSDPFLGIIGYSLTLELTATAGSLLASRKRFESARDAARLAEKLARMQDGNNNDESYFSRTSFSFFRSPSISAQKGEQLPVPTVSAETSLPSEPREESATEEAVVGEAQQTAST